jgi:hypothetical protein
VPYAHGWLAQPVQIEFGAQPTDPKGHLMQVRKPTRLIAVSVVAAIAVSGSAAVASSVITSASIKDGTIQTKDLSKKARKSLKGKAGAAGPQGAAGPGGTAGAKGAAGPPGPVLLKYVTGTPVTPTAGTQASNFAACPPGFHVIGGGVEALSGWGNENVNSSAPYDSTSDTDTIPDNGWLVYVDVFAGSGTINAYAICSLANAVSKTGPTVAAKK